VCLTYEVHELMHTIVTRVYIHTKLDPMTHGASNLDHYCTSCISEKLQNVHIFNLYGIVFEHDDVYIKMTSK